MQIDREIRKAAAQSTAFCVLECGGCTGMCLALYMMLTRDEQDAMRRRFKAGASAVVH